MCTGGNAFSTLPVVHQTTANNQATLIAAATAAAPATAGGGGPAGTNLQMQPVNVCNSLNLLNGFCQTQMPGTTIVLQGPSQQHGSTGQQVLQLHDGTLLHTEQSTANLLTPYGGLFIRCPTTITSGQPTSATHIFSNARLG